MKTRIAVVFALALILWIVALPGIASGDVFLKQKQHNDGMTMMGQTQPEKDLITTVWITDDKIRSDNEEESTIIRVDKGVTYMLNHREKTYMVIPMDMSKIMSSTLPEADKEELKQFQAMMQSMMKMEITITPTNEKEKIGKWNCKKYIQEMKTFMGPVTTEIWATDQIRVNYDVYTKFSAAMFASMPGMQGLAESVAKEMQKVKGVAVKTKTTSTMMGQTFSSSTELLEAKEGKAPAGIFDLPSGYKKTEMGGPGMHHRMR